MGRFKHGLHDEHSKTLEKAALNPRDSFRTKQITQGHLHDRNLFGQSNQIEAFC